MAKRVTKAEKEKNIKQVVEWIIDGCSNNALENKIKQKFEVGLRQARNYKKWANKKIEKFYDQEIEFKRNKRILQTERKLKLLLDSKEVDAKLINSFVNLQNLLIKLEGTEQAKKVKVSGDEENPLAIKWVEEKTYVKPEEEI